MTEAGSNSRLLSNQSSPKMNGKAAPAAPKLTDDEHNVEMKSMQPSGLEAPVNEDIMQLARLGDIPAVQKLFDDGTFEATYCDSEGITPLHVCITGFDSPEDDTEHTAVGCYQQSICHV